MDTCLQICGCSSGPSHWCPFLCFQPLFPICSPSVKLTCTPSTSPLWGHFPVLLTISLPWKGAGSGCRGACVHSSTGETLHGPSWGSLTARSPPSPPGTEPFSPQHCTQPRGFSGLGLGLRARGWETCWLHLVFTVTCSGLGVRVRQLLLSLHSLSPT